MAPITSWDYSQRTVRLVQAAFAIVIFVLCLTSLCLLLFTKINVFVFASAIWTAFFAVPYLALSLVSSYALERRYVIPGVESIIMILWFAGFVAQACSLPFPGQCTAAVCRLSQAAVVFGAFEWALFIFTTGVAVLIALRKPEYTTDDRVRNCQRSTLESSV